MNKITNLARMLLNIEHDFYARLDFSKGERPNADDFEIYIFEQIWANTATGFSGVSGQAITSAFTVVFVPICVNQKCIVYINGRYAYSCDCNEAFMEDLKNQNMVSVARSRKYNINENK